MEPHKRNWAEANGNVPASSRTSKNSGDKLRAEYIGSRVKHSVTPCKYPVTTH